MRDAASGRCTVRGPRTVHSVLVPGALHHPVGSRLLNPSVGHVRPGRCAGLSWGIHTLGASPRLQSRRGHGVMAWVRRLADPAGHVPPGAAPPNPPQRSPGPPGNHILSVRESRTHDSKWEPGPPSCAQDMQGATWKEPVSAVCGGCIWRLCPSSACIPPVSWCSSHGARSYATCTSPAPCASQPHRPHAADSD